MVFSLQRFVEAVFYALMLVLITSLPFPHQSAHIFTGSIVPLSLSGGNP